MVATGEGLRLIESKQYIYIYIIPARDSKQCGGSKMIMYYNVVDDDNVDDTVDGDYNAADVEEEEEENPDVEEDVVEEEDRSQDREADFVQAYASEMHMDIAQEPFSTEVYRKSAGRQSRDTRFVRACTVEMHTDMSRGALCGKLQGKCRMPIPGSAFCASLRSRNAYGHDTRGILRGNL